MAPGGWSLLTQDPIGLAGGVNLYAYAGNNPIGFRDSWGLDSINIHDAKLQAEYDAGKQSLQDCVDGACSDFGQRLNAAIGLTMMHAAEAAPEVIDVYSVAMQGCPTGPPTSNRPNGSGRIIGIDPNNNAWGSAATLSSGVVHEVAEGYMAIGAGKPPFSNRNAWLPLHTATVQFVDDPVLTAQGFATRTARSPHGDTTKRPGTLFQMPR